MGLFRVDGPVYNFGNWVFRFFYLNTLWVLFSLPIVTIGASTTALFYVTHKWAAGEDPPIWQSFWKSYRQNFRQGLVIWVILGAFMLVIFLNIQNITMIGQYSRALLILQLVALAELMFTAIYAFPVLARHHVTVGGCLRWSFYAANRHFITTIVVVLGAVGLLSFAQYLWITYFFLMSLWGYWTSRFVIPVLRKYTTDDND